MAQTYYVSFAHRCGCSVTGRCDNLITEAYFRAVFAATDCQAHMHKERSDAEYEQQFAQRLARVPNDLSGVNVVTTNIPVGSYKGHPIECPTYPIECPTCSDGHLFGVVHYGGPPCLSCGQLITWVDGDDWLCEKCGGRYPIDRSGI